MLERSSNPNVASLKIFQTEPKSATHLDEGWHLHQPATLRQGGFHKKWDVATTANTSRAVPALRAKRGLNERINA
jgi:hypothetical protein